MPRQRMIKPEMWVDEGFLSLSVPARLLFIGLISFADDYGRGLATDRCLKAKVFPADEVTMDDVRKYLGEVTDSVNVRVYEAEGKQYYQLTKWQDHQRVPHPVESTIPEDSGMKLSSSGSVPYDNMRAPEETRLNKEINKEIKKYNVEQARRPASRESVRQVIDHLNTATGRRFDVNCKAAFRTVSARFHAGHTLDDFKAVIDHKVKQWGDDPKMSEYLRPETLFGTKFDSYLATARANNKPVPKVPVGPQIDLEHYEETGEVRVKK